MNFQIRNNMYRFVPYPFYGIHPYGYPPLGFGYAPYYQPYFHQMDHYLIHVMDHTPSQKPTPTPPYFAVPLGGPAL